MAEANPPQPDFAQLIDLASERLGGRAIVANDEFFATKDNLLKPDKPVFIPGKFTEFGKWMDGWETRRRREPGHDWCIVKLGLPGTIRGFNIDTAHFNGNQPESCTIEGAEFPDDPGAEEVTAPAARWLPVLGRTTLGPSAEHFVPVAESAAGKRLTHLRLNIFPDGGIARLRVFGDVLPDWESIKRSGAQLDLGAAVNGGLVVAANNMHFGSRHNLIMPGRAATMGDGWETRRRRGPGYDWCVVRLGHRGAIRKIEVDTNHFKGNFPESCMIECCDAPRTPANEVPETGWRELLARTKLKADNRHFYELELASGNACTHVRLNIYPDGGVSRLRLFGSPA